VSCGSNGPHSLARLLLALDPSRRFGNFFWTPGILGLRPNQPDAAPEHLRRTSPAALANSIIGCRDKYPLEIILFVTLSFVSFAGILKVDSVALIL
jgi:hypothetical protein